MLKSKTFGELPLRGVEGSLSKVPDIRLQGGINIIKCKKKNKKDSIIKKGPNEGPLIYCFKMLNYKRCV